MVGLDVVYFISHNLSLLNEVNILTIPNSGQEERGELWCVTKTLDMSDDGSSLSVVIPSPLVAV